MAINKSFMLCNEIREEELNTLRGEWKAQLKFDGERVISAVLNHEVFMFNRRGKIVNYHFKEVEEELKKLDNCILDGEIIAYNNKFTDLQKRALTKDINKQKDLMIKIPVIYMVFDILKDGEQDLRNLPLKTRFSLLEKKWVAQSPYSEVSHSEMNSNIIKIAQFHEVKDILEFAKLNCCEGIIIKNMNGIYEDRRSKNWLKLKLWKEQTLNIVSYVKNNAGIRAEDKEGNAVQIAGQQSLEVLNRFHKDGQVSVIVQYLTKSKEGRMRFPSYRGIAN